MKKTALTAFAFVFSAMFSAAAVAEVAFVDLAKLEMKSTAFQGIVSQRDRIVKTYGKKFADIDKSLQEKQAAIAAEKDKLSQTELGKKIDALKAEIDAFQNQQREFSKQMQEAMVAALKEVQDKAVTPVLKEISADKKFDAVLNLNQALYVGKNDITDEVIAKVNAKLPKVELKKINLSAAAPKK